MTGSVLSEYTQAVVASALLIAVFALFPARFGRLARWVAVALGAALVDQGSKALLLAYIQRAPHFDYLGTPLLGGWVRINYFQNDALGFDYAFPFLLLSTLAFVLVLAVLYQRLARAHYRMSTLMEIGLALMAGGLLGILLDRVRLKYVVDFLEFGPNSYIYNLADLFTMLGGVLCLTRFGELATFVRIGLRRPMPPMGVAEPSPPLLRTARQTWRPRFQVLSLCAASAVALYCMWQVGMVKLPPLHDAVAKGNLKRAQQLLRQGANVNRPDASGATPLYYAAATADVAIGKLLIDHGADVNAASDRVASPLFEAIFMGCSRSPRGQEFVRLLLDHGAKPDATAFSVALSPPHSRALPLLLKYGFDPNTTKWATPPLLRAAVFDGNAETLKVLLQAGQKANAAGSDGQTALHHAARAGDPQMVQVLLAAGADVSARDGQGNTPLITGASTVATNRQWVKDADRVARESRQVALTLVSHGADVNARSQEGWTPLAEASLHGDAVWVEVLLKAGAQVNVRGARGWTPLHYAAAKGHADVVKLLLAAGADPTLKNDDGALPVTLARDEKVKALLRRA